MNHCGSLEVSIRVERQHLNHCINYEGNSLTWGIDIGAFYMAKQIGAYLEVVLIPGHSYTQRPRYRKFSVSQFNFVEF